MSSSASSASSSVAVPLSSKSEEFRRVQYLLQLSMRDFNTTETCIWNFCTPNLAVEFERATRGQTTLHVWVNANRLGEHNTLESVHASGFKLPASGEGMQFTAGDLDIARSFHSGTSTGGAFRYVLCQIGVGRAFVVDEPSEAVRLPNGYDSVYLAQAQDDEHDASAANGQKAASFRHDYVLFNSAQVLPMYLVQFFADPSDTIGGRGSGGGNGGNTTNAFDMIRNANDNGGGGGVEQLYDRYDFFDPILYVPVSVRDKMVGSHSSGDAALHKLIAIGDAYDAALSESIKPDAALSQRQSDIRSQLRAVDAKLRDVNKNSAQIEEQIYQALQRALFQLQEATQDKMSALLSEEVELRRQLQQADWVESFLSHQRDHAQQVEFLNAWKCHVQLRADMTKDALRTPTVLGAVHADLSLAGGVEVVKGRDIGSNSTRTSKHVAPVTSYAAANATTDSSSTNGMFPPPPSAALAASSRLIGNGIGNYSSGQTNAVGGSGGVDIGGDGGMPSAMDAFKAMRVNTQPSALPMTKTQTGQNLPELPFGGGSAGGGQPRMMMSPTSDGDTTASRSLPTPTDYTSFAYTSGGGASPGGFGLHIPSLNEGGIGVAAADAGPPAEPPALTQSHAVKPLSKRTPKELAQYSLSAEAKRRLRQMALKPTEVAFIVETAFENSKILSKEPLEDVSEENKKAATEAKGTDGSDDDDDDEIVSTSDPMRIVSEAQALYLCVPFGNHEELPQTKLVYASWRQNTERTVQEVLDSLERHEGQTKMDNTPTVMLIRAKNGQVFGGFVNESWSSRGEGLGNSRCFLFSISRDVKIPFRGRETLKGPPSHRDDVEPPPRYFAAKSDLKGMQFGTRDLVINGDMSRCTSEIECSFGVGFPRASKDAQTLLAGVNEFEIEQLELWAILP